MTKQPKWDRTTARPAEYIFPELPHMRTSADLLVVVELLNTMRHLKCCNIRNDGVR